MLVAFLALLMKELRLRFRKERTVWVLIIYVLLMSLLGAIVLISTNNNSYSNVQISTTGNTLYEVFSVLQLLIIIFVVPAYTANAINGEKERQTFDMLVGSRLTGLSLMVGKLLAGLALALLLIATALPLFSLVFFFGGVSVQQFLEAQLITAITTLFVGCMGLFFSTILKQPAVATAVTYVTSLLWLALPLIGSYAWYALSHNTTYNVEYFYIWNPVAVLVNTFLPMNLPQILHIPAAISYSILDLTFSIGFLLLGARFALPRGSRTRGVAKNAVA